MFNVYTTWKNKWKKIALMVLSHKNGETVESRWKIYNKKLTTTRFQIVSMAPPRLICVKKIPPLTYLAYNIQRTSAQVNFLISWFSTQQIWILKAGFGASLQVFGASSFTGFGVIFYSSAPVCKPHPPSDKMHQSVWFV